MQYFLDTEFIEGPQRIHLISLGLVAEDGRELYIENPHVQWAAAHEWIIENVKPYLIGEPELQASLDQWRHLIVDFVAEDTDPQFWAYYADYDWVAFCWLFGRMLDLPDHFPKYCMDLKQWAVQLGNPTLPLQEGTEHNALDDARHNRMVYDYLRKHEHKQMLTALRAINPDATDHDVAVVLTGFTGQG